MNWTKLETAFNRALYFSFSRRRVLLAFPALVLCGVLTVFCRALSINANPWISLCLGFLPFFLSSGILLALGVLLSKMYPRDISGVKINVRRLIASSMDLLIGVAYVSVPPLLVYLVLWVLLGFFFLLKEIPGLGEFFSVIFSFAPFLLIFGSLVLCLINLGILFFLTPSVNLLSVRKGSWIKKVFSFLKLRIFSASCLFAIGVFPLLVTFFLLSLALNFTNTSFLIASGSLSIAIEWFFMMIPFTALISPAILFFFNFSSESYALLQENKRESSN